MYKLAIIDDENHILDMLETFLQRNYSVKTFANPLVALESCKSEDFDLILVDIMMPEMNGLDFLKAIKNIKKNQKVVMMTAFDTMDKALEAHKFGAKNYIKKPFSSLKDVEAKIAIALQEN